MATQKHTAQFEKQHDTNPRDLTPATRLLTETLSPNKQAEINLAMWEGDQRRYDAWLASLPIPKSDQDLIRIVDHVRGSLLAGRGIDKRTAAALKLLWTRDRRDLRNWAIRESVDFLYRNCGFPKSPPDKARPETAFERAGLKFAMSESRPEGLSAEQVRKIYYGKSKLPGKQKTRP